jgi:hypothetical protein
LRKAAGPLLCTMGGLFCAAACSSWRSCAAVGQAVVGRRLCPAGGSPAQLLPTCCAPARQHTPRGGRGGKAAGGSKQPSDLPALPAVQGPQHRRRRPASGACGGGWGVRGALPQVCALLGSSEQLASRCMRLPACLPACAYMHRALGWKRLAPPPPTPMCRLGSRYLRPAQYGADPDALCEWEQWQQQQQQRRGGRFVDRRGARQRRQVSRPSTPQSAAGLSSGAHVARLALARTPAGPAPAGPAAHAFATACRQRMRRWPQLRAGPPPWLPWTSACCPTAPGRPALPLQPTRN